MWPQAAGTTRGFAAVEDGRVGDGEVAGAEGVGAPPAAIVEGGEGGIRFSQAPLEMRLSLSQAHLERNATFLVAEVAY